MDGMSETTVVPGMLRYSCPLECGWSYDAAPPAMADASTGIIPERIAPGGLVAVTEQVMLRKAARLESALREHLATHTTEQFVRTIVQLRDELGHARRTAGEGER